MSLSPSENFICRDWGEYSGHNAPFKKERLLALIFWGGDPSLSVFQGARYIQAEHTETTIPDPNRSVLFNVDTGRIAEPPPSAPMLCFPDLRLPSHVTVSTRPTSLRPPTLPTVFYRVMASSGQILRVWTFKDRLEFSHRYEVIKRRDSDRPCPALPLDSGPALMTIGAITLTVMACPCSSLLSILRPLAVTITCFLGGASMVAL